MSLKEDYLSFFQALLPSGPAWTRDRKAELTKVLNFFAGEFARIHGRAMDLLNEADPRSTIEMLNDWEDVAGLPDPCSAGIADTVQERRLALVQKITGRGGQSAKYFVELAEILGYDIEITENRPFTCGLSECGLHQTVGPYSAQLHQLTDKLDIRYFWKVLVKGPRVTWFQCGASECGKDPLAKITRAEDLECIFQRLKPAHTSLTIAYEGV